MARAAPGRSGDVRIRHAAPSDTDELVRLRLELWPKGSPAAHRSEVEAFFAGPGGGGRMPEAIFVAQVGGHPGLIGFAEVSRRLYAEGCETSPVAYLEGWLVEAGHRGAGVGGALVRAAEDWARRLECREFASDALADDAVSAAAHRALGFEEVEVIRCFRKAL